MGRWDVRMVWRGIARMGECRRKAERTNSADFLLPFSITEDRIPRSRSRLRPSSPSSTTPSYSPPSPSDSASSSSAVPQPSSSPPRSPSSLGPFPSSPPPASSLKTSPLSEHQHTSAGRRFGMEGNAASWDTGPHRRACPSRIERSVHSKPTSVDSSSLEPTLPSLASYSSGPSPASSTTPASSSPPSSSAPPS